MIELTGRKLRVTEAAKRLNVSRARIHQYIEEGRLKVERDSYSNWYLIDEDDLKHLPTGRNWREAHGVKVGDYVRLLVQPRVEGTVKKVREPDELTVECGGKAGMVVVSAWDVEYAEREEVQV